MNMHQHRLGTGFGPFTTTSDIIKGIDLDGKTAIVTGGYSGLGLETSRALSMAGARIVVPTRSIERGRRALDGLDVELAEMDLLDPGSIDRFAADFVTSGRKLDILVNSAGIMAAPLMRDARGYESQFSTNHLGHFQLTQGLLPALLKGREARVVSVSSRGHFFSPVIFDDIHFARREYDSFSAYGQSKTANALFAVELDRRYSDQGLRAVSLHPGAILTNLARYVSADVIKAYGAVDEQGQPVIDPANDKKNPEQGAATIVWCAVSADLDAMGGAYCEDCDVAEMAPAEAMDGRGVKPWAIDPAQAHRLWRESEKMLAGI